MSASTGHLWRILREGTPLAVIYYSRVDVRDALLDELTLLAPEGVNVRVAHDASAAFEHPDEVVALLIDDEPAAVETLDRWRERMADRSMPAVLFLLAGGVAEASLRDHPGLASWVRGREYDPERQEP